MFEDLIKKKGQLDITNYRGRDMIMIMRRLYMIVMLYRCSYLEIHQKKPQCDFTMDELKNEFENYYKLGDKIEQETTFIKVQKMQKEKQIKKIQKKFKEKQDLEYAKLRLDFLV